MCHFTARLLGVVFVSALPILVVPAGGSLAAEDPKFTFLSPPNEDLLRLYWLNNKTGQLGACDYAASKDKAQIGSTKCWPQGQGAGPLGSGRYDLKASNHKKEGSVFRVNVDTGHISICWVRDGKAVCTAPAH